MKSYGSRWNPVQPSELQLVQNPTEILEPEEFPKHFQILGNPMKSEDILWIILKKLFEH